MGFLKLLELGGGGEAMSKTKATRDTLLCGCFSSNNRSDGVNQGESSRASQLCSARLQRVFGKIIQICMLTLQPPGDPPRVKPTEFSNGGVFTRGGTDKAV